VFANISETIASLFVSLGINQKNEDFMNHSQVNFVHWDRQFDRAQAGMESLDTVFQISQVPRTEPFAPPTVLAITSKASAKRLLAALAAQDTPYFYRVSTFECPNLPGMER
jgi:hypothetical protein